MKIVSWLLITLLMGCAQNRGSVFQEKLNDYAAMAADPSEPLDRHLTGSALKSAIETRELLLELGLSQIGISKFSGVIASGVSQAKGCLDVSAVRFLDSNQEPFDVSGRMERRQITASFIKVGDDLLLSELEVGVGRC